MSPFTSERSVHIYNCSYFLYWDCVSRKIKCGLDDFCDFVLGSLTPNMHPYDGTAPKCIAIMENIIALSIM